MRQRQIWLMPMIMSGGAPAEVPRRGTTTAAAPISAGGRAGRTAVLERGARTEAHS